MTTNETPTPRTDAAWQSITVCAPWDAAAEQMAQHARELERELAAERALADRLALILDDIRYYDGLPSDAKQPVSEALAACKEARRDS